MILILEDSFRYDDGYRKTDNGCIVYLRIFFCFLLIHAAADQEGLQCGPDH